MKEKKMLTIAEAFHRYLSNKRKDGIIGLEIETEVLNKRDYPVGVVEFLVDENTGSPCWKVPASKYWTGVHDGSLRNYGIEYILKEPLSYDETLVALDEFKRVFKDVPFLEKQPGTSVHVHLNFQNRTLLELASFITTFSLVENLLTEFSGLSRRSNLFARPHRVAEMQLDTNISMFKRINRGEPTGFVLDEGMNKYAVLNLASLSKLGTAEVRCFRGTTDTDEIKRWVTILHSVYKSALSLKSPKELVSLYRHVGVDLVKTILGPSYPFRYTDGWENLVRRNEYYMVRYANAVDDWSMFGSKYGGTKSRSKKKDSDETLAPGMISWDALDTVLQASHISPAQGETIYPWGVSGNAATVVIDDTYEEDLP